jgi:hypothetical protein
MQRRNNNRRGAKPRRGVLRRTANGVTQNGAGVSHQDSVPQVRKFQVFQELPFVTATSDYAIGLDNFNINGANSPLKELLTAYAGFYEQYRIRKIKVRAQVGKGFDNDKRIKTLVGARVDVDKQPQSTTIQTVQMVNCSENAVIKTFTERGNVLLATYRPQCRVNTTASMPILPNRLQFFPIGDHTTHVWKGCTVTCMIPEPSIQPNSLAITLIAEVDVEFRGRISDQIVFSTTTINQGPQLVPFDLEESQANLKNGLLTGTYVPLSAWPINIVNIGSTITASEIIGLTFRRQSDMKKFEIAMYADTIYGATLIA